MHELHAISSGEIHDIIEYEDWSRTDDLYYPKAEVDAVLAELHRKYELALATIKEYKNDIANLNEKLDEANMRADLAEAANTEYHIDIQNLQKRIEELT